MRGPRDSLTILHHAAASPRDRTAPQMASPLPAPPPPPLIKRETDDEENPGTGRSPELPVKREDAAADDGDDEAAAGAAVKQEEGEGPLGREIVRTLVKSEVEEEDAPDLKIVKVEDATEISDEAAADSRDGRPEAPDRNFVEVELSEEDDVGGDGARPRTRHDLATRAPSRAGERPHACGDCGRRFARRGDLRRHGRTHAAGGREKPHACGDCGRRFARRGDLWNHARTHAAADSRDGRPEAPDRNSVEVESSEGEDDVGGAASPRDRTAPQMASPLPAPPSPPPPLIKRETDDEESPGTGRSPELPVKREDAAADDGDDEAAGAVVKQEVGEGPLGREIVRTLVKSEVEEEDAPDLKIVKVEDATEISDEATADSRDGRPEAPDRNSVEVELSEEDDVGGDGADPGTEPRPGRPAATTAADAADGGRHACAECGKRFARAYGLKTHARTHTGERPHACGACGKRFGTRHNLATHARVHTGERPHPCGACGRAFSQLGDLRKHARTHTGERPYACGVCGRGFVRRFALKTHARTHARPPDVANARRAAVGAGSPKRRQRRGPPARGGERPHACPECGRGFAHRYLLEIHALSHTGERPHACGVCGRGFARRGDLRKHARTHAAGGGEKPHACGDCGRAFSHRYLLGIHARVHTGERPHACGVCGRSFAQRNVLKSHALTHTGERPHACAECGRAFSQRSNLEAHARVHTGERPHACGDCGRGFSRRSDLRRHARTHGAGGADAASAPGS
ncbi:uncharacterized protein LOC116957894 isoform X2 [Petromyzon marinus]|uniref:Zinc finger and SCAN domain-containing protein 2-like isoform X2 n=1 Tax=Petromyzon marinus TaxID=7757 RepID=A0AAJ7UH71_PETMA|nr:zinc finger and SCAN domain-containing protein 2-like isoform X2 [Petromyzon marinus]